jgi:hypothetical protein
MAKKLIALLGIILCLIGIYSMTALKKSERQALLKDKQKTAYGMVSDDTPPFCNWEVTPPERVLSENKSQAIVIKTSNSEETKECQSIVSLQAPGFDASPAKDEQKITLPPKSKGSVSWILTPRKTGVFQVSVSDVFNTKIFGITVTTLFGLSAFQAKIFSILGTIFGPMLTVPWWWEKLRSRGTQKQKNESQ